MTSDVYLREDLANANHENILLKTKITYVIEDHNRKAKEMKIIHKAQLEEALNIIQELKNNSINYKHLMSTDDNLQKENLQLNQKILFYEDELKNILLKLEKCEKDARTTSEEKRKRVLELESSLRHLNEENDDLHVQISDLEADLSKQTDLYWKQEKYSLEDKRSMEQLKTSLQDIEEKFRCHVASANAEVEKFKSQLLYAEKSYKSQIQDLEYSLSEERNKIEGWERQLLSMEKKWQANISEEKKISFEKNEALLKDNADYLEKLTLLEAKNLCGGTENGKMLEAQYELKKKSEKYASSVIQIAMLENKSKQLQDSLNDAVHKEKLSDQVEVKLKNVTKEMQNWKNKCTESLNQTEELQVSYENQSMLFHKEKSVLNKENLNHIEALNVEIQQKEAQLMELRLTLKSSNDDFENDNKKYMIEMKKLKKKLRTYTKLIKKLRYRLESSSLRHKELESRHLALKDDTVPAKLHRNLLKHLQHYVGRHMEFRALMQGVMNGKSGLAQVGDMQSTVNMISDKLTELKLDQDKFLEDKRADIKY